MEVRNMRHPVLEKIGVKFVPNDILLGN